MIDLDLVAIFLQELRDQINHFIEWKLSSTEAQGGVTGTMDTSHSASSASVPSAPSAVEEGESTTLPESPKAGIVRQDAAVWVFIAAFIGLAVAWSTGFAAPWAGALIGGGIAFLIGAIAIAAQE
jgi:hypothetical protein